MEKEKLEDLISWIRELCKEIYGKGKKVFSTRSEKLRQETKKDYDSSVKKMSAFANALQDCLNNEAVPSEEAYVKFLVEKIYKAGIMKHKKMHVVEVAKLFKEWCEIESYTNGNLTYLHAFENAYQEKNWKELEEYNKIKKDIENVDLSEEKLLYFDSDKMEELRKKREELISKVITVITSEETSKETSEKDNKSNAALSFLIKGFVRRELEQCIEDIIGWNQNNSQEWLKTEKINKSYIIETEKGKRLNEYHAFLKETNIIRCATIRNDGDYLYKIQKGCYKFLNEERPNGKVRFRIWSGELEGDHLEVHDYYRIISDFQETRELETENKDFEFTTMYYNAFVHFDSAVVLYKWVKNHDYKDSDIKKVAQKIVGIEKSVGYHYGGVLNSILKNADSMDEILQTVQSDYCYYTSRDYHLFQEECHKKFRIYLINKYMNFFEEEDRKRVELEEDLLLLRKRILFTIHYCIEEIKNDGEAKDLCYEVLEKCMKKIKDNALRKEEYEVMIKQIYLHTLKRDGANNFSPASELSLKENWNYAVSYLEDTYESIISSIERCKEIKTKCIEEFMWGDVKDKVQRFFGIIMLRPSQPDFQLI